jgi:competence ComEA-like helix-hairpin-helix protein
MLVTPPRTPQKATTAGLQTGAALMQDFSDAPAIPLPVKSFLEQLPTQLVRNGRSLVSATAALPASLVLPQLATGKVTIQLCDLIPLLPEEALPQPLPDLPANQCIVLPLAELIAAVPPELLSVKHEACVQVDTAEFNSLPALFEEQTSEETPAPAEVFIEENAPVEPVAEVAPTIDREVAHPALVSEVPEHVQMSLRSLVALLPDEVLAAPRSELWRNMDPSLPVLLPAEPILTQLRSAKISLPLAVVLEAVPRTLLVDPLPNVDGREITIPLAEIVSQLPPRLFTEQAREVEESVEQIPEPFVEQSPVSEPTEPEKSEQAEQVIETSVETAPEAAAPALQPPDESPAAPPKPEPAEAASGFNAQRFLIDINRCTVENLTKIPGIGLSMAQRIIDFRNARGQFASIQELKSVPGVGRKTFRALTGFEPCLLNSLLGVEHNDELSLQEIVRLASKLPGVAGCILAMSDGLFLTGELPPHLDKESISVFAPQLFRKLGRYMRELRVGQIRRFTIFTDQQPMSIFRGGETYLIVIHDQKRFSKALLRRCERISDEIARLCRQRAVV